MSYIDLNKLKKMVESDERVYFFFYNDTNTVIKKVKILNKKEQELRITISAPGLIQQNVIDLTADELEESLIIYKDVSEDMPDFLT